MQGFTSPETPSPLTNPFAPHLRHRQSSHHASPLTDDDTPNNTQSRVCHVYGIWRPNTPGPDKNSPPQQPPPQPRPKRAQVSRACDWCRLTRVKCDSFRPCRNCKDAKRECVNAGRDDFKSVAAATKYGLKPSPPGLQDANVEQGGAEVESAGSRARGKSHVAVVQQPR